MSMPWPLLIYFVFVVDVVIAVLFVSNLLGQRRSEPTTSERYEGGIVFRKARRVCAFSVRYYLFFNLEVISDLEVISLFALGAIREGWPVMPWFSCS